MRKIFLIQAFVFSWINTYPQSDTLVNDILKTQVFRKGVYRTFEEFRTNSPSITSNYYIEERTGAQEYWLNKDNKKVRILNEHSGKYEKEEDYIWGYCDGDNIYVLYALDDYSSENFCKLIVRGKFSVFMYQGYGNAATYWLLRMKMYMTKEFFFDIDKGEFKKLNNVNLEKMLKINTALYNRFTFEPNKKALRYEYIKVLNNLYK